MRIYPLFSSSKGNSYFVGTKKGGVLVDCGVSCRQIQAALTANDLPLDSVKAIFLTHEHSDHVKGLNVFIKRCEVPVYATAGTLAVLPGISDCRVTNDTVTLPECNIEVRLIPTSHDAAAPCGYHFTDTAGEGGKLVILTDTGAVTKAARTIARGAETVVLESNYDPDMLKYGDYPGYLKARIAGRRGHLSNEQCAEFARELLFFGTRNIILAHISQNNNTPDKAYNTFLSGTDGFINGRDYFLKVLSPVCEPWFCAV
jgi:phosphoribosyl 1,2-cyclic phosphodiesterase